jgi:putative restriction endonuclease
MSLLFPAVFANVGYKDDNCDGGFCMEKKRQRIWNRDELLVAFRLYCRTPFGRLHRSNPEIVEIAKLLGRTPSALAMKLVNFASMDPHHAARNVRGLSHASTSDRQIWMEFHEDWEELAFLSQEAAERLGATCLGEHLSVDQKMTVDRKTERRSEVRIRIGQQFFREAVLAAYDTRCAICAFALRDILNASHIVPWSVDSKRRVDPTNGLALCSLHDRAFDRGLISIDSEYRVLLSGPAKVPSDCELHIVGLHRIEGCTITLPERFQPDQTALEYHRTNIFNH